jgi:hypothetical protein
MAKRAASRAIVEVQDASRAVLASRGGAVADLIERAAGKH